MTTALAPTPTVCTEVSCQQAESHTITCKCSCGGTDHGLVHRARFQAARDRIDARIARTGDVFLGAANDDCDEPF